ELAHALKHNKRIIPLLVRDVESTCVAAAVQKLNWILCRAEDDFNSAVNRVHESIRTDLEWVRAHTRILTRALEWGRHDHDTSYALRGTDLKKAEALLASETQKEPRLTPEQIGYILQSRKAATLRLGMVAASSAIGLILLLVLGSLFVLKRQ